MVGILGHSGCGKTTLLHAVAGLLPWLRPATVTGSLRLDGDSLAELDPGQRARLIATCLDRAERPALPADAGPGAARPPSDFTDGRPCCRGWSSGWGSSRCSSAAPPRSPRGSASGSRWRSPSPPRPARCCSTSRRSTSTRSPSTLSPTPCTRSLTPVASCSSPSRPGGASPVWCTAGCGSTAGGCHPPTRHAHRRCPPPRHASGVHARARGRGAHRGARRTLPSGRDRPRAPPGGDRARHWPQRRRQDLPGPSAGRLRSSRRGTGPPRPPAAGPDAPHRPTSSCSPPRLPRSSSSSGWAPRRQLGCSPDTGWSTSPPVRRGASRGASANAWSTPPSTCSAPRS